MRVKVIMSRGPAATQIEVLPGPIFGIVGVELRKS